MKRIIFTVLIALAVTSSFAFAKPAKPFDIFAYCHTYDNSNPGSVIGHYAWVGGKTAQLAAENATYTRQDTHLGGSTYVTCFYVLVMAPID